MGGVGLTRPRPLVGGLGGFFLVVWWVGLVGGFLRASPELG